MALSQSIETPYGVPATYWTITRFSIDRVNLSIEMQLAGYASEDACNARQTPLTQRSYNVNFAENPPEPTEGLTSYLGSMGIPTQAITPELIQLF